jgi:hypothetical protein
MLLDIPAAIASKNYEHSRRVCQAWVVPSARVGAHPKAPSPSPWRRGFFRARVLCHQHDLAAEPIRTCKFALAIASLMKWRTIRAMASGKR